MTRPKATLKYRSILAANLKPGNHILWFGKIRQVKKTKRSLGNGYQVTLSTGFTISGMVNATLVTEVTK